MNPSPSLLRSGAALRSVRIVLLLGLVAAGLACDRNTEPYVPGEEPQAPDLSRIFPEVDDQGRPVAFPDRAGLDEPDPMGSARGGAAGPTAGAPPMGGGARAQADAAAPIRGSVHIAPGLESRAPEGGVLFVIARRGTAGPPLAVKRIASPSFPVEFQIGPENVMVPTFEFAGEIRLTARLDADGNAASAPGDLAGGAPGTYAPGARDVSIVLDQVL